MRDRITILGVLLLSACKVDPLGNGGVEGNLTALEVDCATAKVDLEIAVQDFAFEPMDALLLGDGGVIKWTNEGASGHSITSGAPIGMNNGELFDAQLEPGDDLCLEIIGVGSVEYFCSSHPLQMSGATLTLEPAEPVDGDYGDPPQR